MKAHGLPSPLFHIARWGFFAISLLALVYHGLILTGVVDYKYAWGGRLQSREAMLQMEGVSVAIQLFFVFYVYWAVPKALRSQLRWLRLMAVAVLLAMALLFFVNTLGNLAALSPFEKWAFTPLTLLSALFCLQMALDIWRAGKSR